MYPGILKRIKLTFIGLEPHENQNYLWKLYGSAHTFYFHPHCNRVRCTKKTKTVWQSKFVFSQFSSKTVLIYYKRVFFDLEDLTNKPKNVIDKDNVSTSDASVSGRVQHMHHTCLSVCVEALKVTHTLHSSIWHIVVNRIDLF